jgi:hypothetical protein
MAQITFNNVPDEAINKIVVRFGWTTETGMSKQAFFKRFIADYVKGVYSQIVQEEGAEAARIAAKAVDIT